MNQVRLWYKFDLLHIHCVLVSKDTLLSDISQFCNEISAEALGSCCPLVAELLRNVQIQWDLSTFMSQKLSLILKHFLGQKDTQIFQDGYQSELCGFCQDFIDFRFKM